MSIELVSPEYDLDFVENLEKTSKWNYHAIKHLNEGYPYRKGFETPHEQQSLKNRLVKPMMSSCSAAYKQNADGSWEVRTDVTFKTNTTKEKEKENTNENSSSGQGTTAKDNDPPDSRDRSEANHN